MRCVRRGDIVEGLDSQSSHTLKQALGYVYYVRLGQVVQNDCELFAPVAGGQVEWASRHALNNSGDASECDITHQVPMRIVVSLEMIDVDHEDADGASITHGLLPGSMQVVIETATVHEPRQSIAHRKFVDDRALQEALPVGPVDVPGNDRAENHG